ncbi:MAG: N-formylglutamate amidohydrolase [Pseudomonadota bacterium]
MTDFTAKAKGLIKAKAMPPPAVTISQAIAPGRPVIFTSPHSGRYYPPRFLAQSQLDDVTLRRSEDGYIDELFAAAPCAGATFITANYPRAYVDVNRGPFELDPTMFADPLPPYVDSASERVAFGLGTIPRIVGAGLDIYRTRLRFAEAEQRIKRIYHPFHHALGEQVQAMRERFGFAVLVDCHSMPSTLDARKDRLLGGQPDVVLGDCFGAGCALALVEFAETTLRRLGLKVARNDPYAGGYITRTYGRPEKGIHALQIEIARALYMDEHRIAKHGGFASLRDLLTLFVQRLAAQAAALGLAEDAPPPRRLAAE